MAKQYFPTFRRIGSGIASLWRNPRLLGVPFVRMGRWALRVAPKVGFALLVLFVLAAIPWTYFNIKYGRELEAELARIKAAGEPLTMTEAAPKPVPDDQNAAVLYNEVFRIDWERFQAHQEPEPAAPPEEPRPDQTPRPVREGFQDLPAEWVRAVEAYDGGQRGEAEATVRHALSDRRVRQRLAIVREASRLPDAVFPVKWEAGAAALFPHLARYREAARWVTAKMLVTAAAGDVDDALEWCEVALRMSEHAASEPTLIAQLVGIAMQAIALKGAEEMLAGAAPPTAAVADFQRYLAGLDIKTPLHNAMLRERAWDLRGFEQVRQLGATGDEALVYAREPWEKPLLRICGSALALPLYKFDKLTYLRHMARRIPSMRPPYRRAQPRLKTLDQEIWQMTTLALGSRMILPKYPRATAERDRAIARLDEFRIVLALKVYKQQHGAYPETLDELQRTLSWELPKDVFSGEAFRYQRKGEGFMLYSFGQDLDDDGGVREEDRKYQDGDIVWECAK